MPKIYDSIEVGLTRDELRQALRCWMDRKTLISSYVVTDVALHPGAKYVVRFTVEPPLEKEDKKTIANGDTAISRTPTHQ